MENFLEISTELQAVFVTGYVGYKIAGIGSSREDKTEDIIFKVLTYGLLSRILAEFLIPLANSNVKIWEKYIRIGENGKIVLMLFTAILIASIWKKFGSDAFSSIMGGVGVYRDDHAHTALRSLTSARALWKHIHIHTEDGKIFESDFGKVPSYLPLNGVTINDDGIAVYVTKVYGVDDSETSHPILEDGESSVISFFPVDQIKQIDINWKKI